MVDSTTRLVVAASSQSGVGSADVSLAEILAGLTDAQKTALRAAIGAEATSDLAAIATSGATGDLVGTIAATQLAGGFAQHALIAGGAAGDHAVSAIKTGDELDEVIYYVGAGTAVTDISDLTAEFMIKAGNGVINNTGHTDTTGGKLLVRWTKKTA